MVVSIIPAYKIMGLFSLLALAPELIFWILHVLQPRVDKLFLYILSYTSSVSMMILATLLLLHLGRAYIILGILLLPILLVIFHLFLKGYSGGFACNATDYDDSRLKLAFDNATKSTIASCAGLASLIFGYSVNSPQQSFVVKYSECATFLAILVGAFVMLLTSIKLSLSSRSTRNLLVKVLNSLSYISSVLQASADLGAAAVVLGICGVLTPFFIVIVQAARWFIRRFIVDQEASSGTEDNLKELSLGIFYACHALSMVFYSISAEAEETYSFTLSIGMLITTSASTNALTTMLLP